MKIINENVDLEDFEAWSTGRNVLDELIECGTVGKAQAEIEELWPDGITATQLNDYLWFQIKDDHPEWFDDNREEKDKVRSEVEKTHRSDGPLGFIPLMEAEDGTLYRLNYEDDYNDFTVFKLVAELQVTTNNISVWLSDYEVDYDFSESFEWNVEALKRAMAEDGVRPALPPDMEYVESFPCWAVYYCVYGEDGEMSEEDRKLVDEFMDENGYSELVSSLEESRNGFDRHPAFGLACDTETVVMRKRKACDANRDKTDHEEGPRGS